MTEFVVITGLSGAGRSTAADVLEDQGWFVIDNMPVALMPKVAELADAPGSASDRVGFVAGWNTDPSELRPMLQKTKQIVAIITADIDYGFSLDSRSDSESSFVKRLHQSIPLNIAAPLCINWTTQNLKRSFAPGHELLN